MSQSEILFGDGIPLPPTPEQVLGEEKYPLQRLNSRHLRIAELSLAGMDNRSIARELDVTPTMVNLVVRNPLVQAEISRRRKEQQRVTDERLGSRIDGAIGVLKAAEAKAAMKMVDMIDHHDARIAISAAKDVLDRGGIGTSGVGTTQLNISGDRIQLLLVALRESKSYDGPSANESELQGLLKESA